MDNGKLPGQIMTLIEKMSEDDLRNLNNIIVDRLRLMSNANALKELSKFNLGDIVSFEHYGKVIKGRIIKINQKTVSMLTLDNKQKWKVAPVFLKKEKDAEVYEEEPDIHDVTPKKNNQIISDRSNDLQKEFEFFRDNSDTKVSRNAPCPCGSGKKYKLCCGK